MNNKNIMEEVLLKVGGLKISFGESVIVNSISFSVGRGEILGIVGESGSGKSMTALSLMRLCPPDAKISAEHGVWYYPERSDGFNLLKLKDKQVRRLRGNKVSMIFQEPMTSLNAVQKCGAQVAEVLKIHNKAKGKALKQMVLDLFSEVLLPEPIQVWSKYPHQLSGGQRQRIMIAMALACNPSLLIADEPTTALDVTVQKSVLELLLSLQKKYGMSIVFITHDLSVVQKVCQRVLVMQNGNIVEELRVEKLSEMQASHPYTQGLLACRPRNNEKPHRLKTFNNFLQDSNETTILKIEKQQIKEKIILDVQNLSKHFPVGKNFIGKPSVWYKAVDEVSFQMLQGKTLGLVGESGCGKTTLSRTLLKLIEPTSGMAIFSGSDVFSFDKKQMKNFRKDVQIVFQDPYSSLNPSMTIGNALAEPLKVHKMFSRKSERTDYIVDILKKTGLLADDMRKYPHQFSGGQRQRIVIARAIVLRPRLIICDEPVSSLDVSVQAQVLNLLNDLKESMGLTYLFISHDLSVVRYMSDSILVMYKGRIVESGSSDSVFDNPQSEYTQRLIDASL